jgi:hypothetical protein
MDLKNARLEAAIFILHKYYALPKLSFAQGIKCSINIGNNTVDLFAI